MIPTINDIAREQVARFQQTRQLPSWPPAVRWLNYPSIGPDVGTVLGPNQMGEYLTVVEHDGARVGLAYGVIQLAPAEVES
jgi:hypothetical protein